MCIDLLPEKLLQLTKLLKRKKNYMNTTPLPKILQMVTLVSQLLLNNAKIFKKWILISTCDLFRI